MDDGWPDSARRWRIVVTVAILGILAFAAVRYYDKITRRSRDGTLSKSAFLRWRDQIQALDAGDDIYRKFNYPNPPIQALVLMPLTRLDRTPGAMLWFALKVAMAAAAWVWACRLCAGPGGVLPLRSQIVAGLFTLHPVLGDLSHGNVNIFIAFLVFGALEAFRRGWDITAGLVLALGIACKVTPALFLPYFVWKRAWKMVAATLVGCGLWLGVVPAAALGWEHNNQLLTSWFDTMVRPFLIDGQITSEHANQSLPGLTVRLLTAAPSDVSYDEDDHAVAAEFHNLVDIGPANARLLVRGFQAVYVVLGVLLLRTPIHWPGVSRAGVAMAAEFAFIILGMLLFSERTWKHHGVVLMLPFLVVASYHFTQPLSRLARTLSRVANLAVFGLIAGPSLLGGDAQDTALAYGSHTAVFLILLTQICLILARERAVRSRAAAAH